MRTALGWVGKAGTGTGERCLSDGSVSGCFSNGTEHSRQLKVLAAAHSAHWVAYSTAYQFKVNFI